MTHTQVPGVAAPPGHILSERENARAVDLIENAERDASYCACGSHVTAVAHDGQVWLECAELGRRRRGLDSLVSKLTSWSHTRSMIMELPTD